MKTNKLINITSILFLFLTHVSLSQDIQFTQIYPTPSNNQKIGNFENVNWSSFDYGDIDSDGDLDLVISGTISSFDTIYFCRIYKNDGNGNFIEVIDSGLAGIRGTVSFEDINNDTYLDLLIMGDSGNFENSFQNDRLYINDGNGNFKRIDNPFLPVGNGRSIAFADVDNDNDSDVLINGENFDDFSTETRLYLNDGRGNYSESSELQFEGAIQGSIDFSDIDNDKDQDVLITGNGRNIVTKLYLNDGNGNYDISSDTAFEGVYFSDASFADVNNDNYIDVIISGRTVSNTFISKLYINNGDGTFNEELNTNFIEVNYSSTLFSDVDNDNDQDLLISGSKDLNNSRNGISKLYINDGLGNYEEIQNTPFQNRNFIVSSFIDFDNDNDLDLSVIDGNLNFRSYSNNGNGVFSEITYLDTFDQGMGSRIAFSDIDNDNDNDILISGSNSFSSFYCKLYKNEGDGNYSLIPDTPFPGIINGDIAFSDIDNDNDEDLLISGVSQINPLVTITKLYKNDGVGNYTEIVNTPFPKVSDGSFSFADIDNDGDQDLLITGVSRNEGNREHITKLYKNDGIGNYIIVPNTVFEGVAYGAVAFSDIDNDNDLDLFITGEGENSNYEDSSRLYINDGLGNFIEVSNSNIEGSSYGDAEFSDIDNDNDPDLLVTQGFLGSTPGIVSLYTNDGKGNFMKVPNTQFEGVSGGSISFVDIDNDHDQDVIIGGSKNFYSEATTATLNLYINDGLGGFNKSNQNIFDNIASGEVLCFDIDNDQDQDVLISGINSRGFLTKIYNNIGEYPVKGIDEQIICESSYTWIDGITYTKNNFSSTYIIENGAISGRDSIVRLKLKIMDIQECQDNSLTDIIVFPNPIENSINISFGNLIGTNLNIFNINGSSVYEEKNITEPNYEIDLEIASGVYFLQLSLNEEVRLLKLIKK